jgi:protein-S-isoprenylcysteine O-methyltransferase Ste14
MDPRLSSRAGLVLAVLALVVLVIRGSILADHVVTILVQVLAALLMVWARVTFGRRSFHATADPTEGGLVTSGPYHYLRHPIYAAVCYFLWAGVLSHLSVWDVQVGLVATFGLLLRIFAEERLVTERYPEYAAYAGRTKRIIPFVW